MAYPPLSAHGSVVGSLASRIASLVVPTIACARHKYGRSYSLYFTMRACHQTARAYLLYWCAYTYCTLRCVPEEKPLLADQPCDWEGNREFLLGTTVSVFDIGPTDGDYPLACSAGYVCDLIEIGRQTSLVY